MPVYTDQLGRKVNIPNRPCRIISIVPSQSELLVDLGLWQEIVGITKFCVHPPELFSTKERVGGTKQLNLEKIRSLNPDLIIGNKEENDQTQIEILEKEFPVWMSDIYTIEDAKNMMMDLGEIVGKKNESKKIVNKLDEELSLIKNSFNQPSVLYFIWNKPYMGAASSTFIDAVLQHLGFKNVLNLVKRYPELDEKTLKQLNPEYCFLSSEPFPFNENHSVELQQILPNTKIKIVDGELFSWYGTRLLKLASYAKELKKEILN